MKKMSTEAQKKANGGQTGYYNWLIDQAKQSANVYAVTYLYIKSKF